jgi:hypothetical protein
MLFLYQGMRGGPRGLHRVRGCWRPGKGRSPVRPLVNSWQRQFFYFFFFFLCFKCHFFVTPQWEYTSVYSHRYCFIEESLQCDVVEMPTSDHRAAGGRANNLATPYLKPHDAGKLGDLKSIHWTFKAPHVFKGIIWQKIIRGVMNCHKGVI